MDNIRIASIQRSSLYCLGMLYVQQKGLGTQTFFKILGLPLSNTQAYFAQINMCVGHLFFVKILGLSLPNTLAYFTTERQSQVKKVYSIVFGFSITFSNYFFFV
jgi:hypothetical protein